MAAVGPGGASRSGAIAVLTAAISSVGPALVFLEIEREGGETSLGTGYLVSATGAAITAEHLVRGAQRVRARVVNAAAGRREAFECRIAEADERADVALLRPEGRAPAGLATVTLHRGAPPALGRDVAFMGFPYADIFDPPLAMTVRGLLANRYSLGGTEYIVVDAICAEGMSGGPLFLADSGQVIGTVGARFDPARARAKLRGRSEAEAAELAKERVNITFASSGAYALAMLARHGIR